MIKQTVFAFLRTIAFLLAVLLLFVVFSVFGEISNSADQSYYAAYSTPDNENLDVAFFGASHCTDAFYPLNLYEDTGLTSYNYSAQGQSMEDVYWTIKEVLDHQQPKVVVLEAFLLSWPYNWTGSAGSLFWTGGVRKLISDFSPNKILAAQSISANYDAIDELYRFPTYRYDWKNWSRSKLLGLRKNSITNLTFGSSLNDETWDMQADPWVDYDTGSSPDNVQINEDMLEIMQRILALTQEHNTTLVLALAPYKTIDAEDYCYDKIEQWCAENDVPFWNGVDAVAEDGWDYSALQFDRGHQNVAGGLKTTALFGSYLTENLGLTPHRTAEWDAYLERYHQYFQERAFRSCSSLDEFLSQALALPDGYAFILSADNGSVSALSAEQLDAMHSLGFSDLGSTDRYVGLCGDGQIWQDSTAPTVDILFNGSSFYLSSADSVEDDATPGEIMLDRNIVNNTGHLRIAVYSIEQASIIAAFVQ